MNKSEFVNYISKKYNCTKVEGDKIINMFTSSLIDAMRDGNEISLLGFGQFSITKIAPRDGRNPHTGEPVKIAAYNKAKFKVGKKLKDAINKK